MLDMVAGDTAPRTSLPPARDAMKDQEQLLLVTSILIRMTTMTFACCAAAWDPPPYASPRSSWSRFFCDASNGEIQKTPNADCFEPLYYKLSNIPSVAVLDRRGQRSASGCLKNVSLTS